MEVDPLTRELSIAVIISSISLWFVFVHAGSVSMFHQIVFFADILEKAQKNWKKPLSRLLIGLFN